MCIGNCGGHETGLVELAAEACQRRLILGCARVPLTSELLGLAGELGIDELDTAYNYNSFRSLEQLRVSRLPKLFGLPQRSVSSSVRGVERDTVSTPSNWAPQLRTPCVA